MIIREQKNICSEMHDEVVPAVQHFDIQECRRSVWCKRREPGQDRAGVGGVWRWVYWIGEQVRQPCEERAQSKEKHEIKELIIVIRQQTMKENAGKDRIC